MAEAFLITWQTPDGRADSREVESGELLIGRDPACDIVLDDVQVSRRHARLRVADGALLLEDLGSRNGVFVNGDRVVAIELRPGDEVTVGRVAITLRGPRMDVTQLAGDAATATIVLDPSEAAALREEAAARPVAQPGVVPPELLADRVLSERALRDHGVEVREAEFAALGGGLGSFVWADLLRVRGVPADAITVVGLDEHAATRYRRLCANSQIPDHERLRSHSESCPDNVWGFPGYALREAWAAFRRGRVRAGLAPLWGVFAEPVLGQTWTPRAGDVFDAIEREEARIGWSGMRLPGRIRAIRQTDAGRFVAIVSLSDAAQRRHVAVAARFLHVATGYPAIQLLPDLADFRERTGDHRRVVNAYEDHSHIYDDLRAHGGAVLLRGRGIVASRILQRLTEERARNPDIQIIHLHRSRLSRGNRYGRARRRVVDQWEMQPFNWPKSCWGGQLRFALEAADDSERQRLLGAWGGTTTADRADWRAIVDRGTREGWYRPEYGTVDSVDPADGRVVTRVSSKLGGGGTLELHVDYVIDCTGLVAGLERSPLLADLAEHYALPRNPLGRLAVSDDFEIEALRHGDARCYAAGAATLGGPFAAVDSFLGLQYAALRSVDAIQRATDGGLRGLTPWRSIRQWGRWVRGAAP